MNKPYWKLHSNRNSAQKIIQTDINFDDDSILPFVVNPQSDPARGQVQFCHNLIVNLFEKGNSPHIQVQRKNFKKTLDHYLPAISNMTTSPYGLYTIEIWSPQSSNQPPHRI